MAQIRGGARIDISRHGLRHIKLPTACSVIYVEITGTTPTSRAPAEMQAILNDVAHAISHLVAIYAAVPDSEVPRVISPLELIEGKFLNGAHSFVTTKGTELRGLTVQRRDIDTAVTILKAARIAFVPPPRP